MRTLAFDGRTGASGDMVLAALIDAGADPDVLAPVEAALDVRYAVGRTTRHGVSATTVEVLLTDDGDQGGDADRDARHDHEHGPADTGGRTAEGHGTSRSHDEVVEIVEALDLDPAVEADALSIFDLLAAAEAAVHDADRAGVHFHEVGADDALADVVGSCLLLADLDVDRVVTTPLATGSGDVATGHGTYPVPVPAVVELAAGADWSIQGGPVEAELLTPTGAAILAHFAEGVDAVPPLRIRGSGYGAGDRDLVDRPNVLRALIGDERGRLRRDDVAVLETNLDDATPEVLGSLQETLVEAGARDVSILPATMKKSRPGHLVKVVCRPSDAERLARKLAVETGTLGVREHGAGHRWIADRTLETVTVEAGGESHDVAVKVASDADGDVYDVSAEYDDALAVARETGVPVREVMRRAVETRHE